MNYLNFNFLIIFIIQLHFFKISKNYQIFFINFLKNYQNFLNFLLYLIYLSLFNFYLINILKFKRIVF